MRSMAVRAVLFDVYGTLLDVHSAVAREGSALGDKAEPVSRLWRQKQLEYTWIYTLRGAYRSFRALTEAALDFALATHGVDAGAQRLRLLSAYDNLTPYADTAPALAQLRQRGLRLAALSNGDPDMLEAGLRSAGLRDQLDAVLSVAPLRVFKPDRRVYELGRAWANAPAAEVAFVSANAWDAAGGAGFGFRTFWINRTGQPPEYGIATEVAVVGSLQDVALALG